MDDDPEPFIWRNFATLYQEIVTTEAKGEHLQSLWNSMCGIVEYTDPTTLTMPENGFQKIYGFLILRSENLFNEDGAVVMQVCIGDVIVQSCWDRDVVVTHSPLIQIIPSPQLVRHKCLRGKLMPLYSKELVEKITKRRTDLYLEEQAVFLKAEL